MKVKRMLREEEELFKNKIDKLEKTKCNNTNHNLTDNNLWNNQEESTTLSVDMEANQYKSQFSVTTQSKLLLTFFRER